MGIRLTLAVVLALLLQGRPDGGVWGQPNRDPTILTAADVDPLMWPIVDRINHSGWVWTTESCQGHDGGYPLTLGLVTDDPGRWFAQLAAAHAAIVTSPARERQDPHGLHFDVAFWITPQVRRGHTQIRLQVKDGGSWPTALRVLTELSLRLSLT